MLLSPVLGLKSCGSILFVSVICSRVKYMMASTSIKKENLRKDDKFDNDSF